MEKKVSQSTQKRPGPKQRFILYTLGEYYTQANRKLKNRNLTITISKSVFIDLLKKTKITNNQKRALYKNLADLETKKLITYNKKVLSLTKKGSTQYKRIKSNLEAYINLAKVLSSTELHRLAKRSQTRLSK